MHILNQKSHTKLDIAASEFAGKLSSLLKKINYDQINYRLRGGDDYCRTPLPCMSYSLLRHDFEKDFLKDKFLNSKDHLIAKLFLLNMSVSRQSVEQELGFEIISSGIKAGVFILQDQQLRTDNLCLSSLKLTNNKVVYFFSDAPSHYFDKQAGNRVYSNHDSYLLKLFLSASSQTKAAKSCMEFGSGSGLQLIALSAENSQLARSIGLEIDQRARRISRFNIELNGLSDRISIISDPAQLGNFKSDLIISNPPFLPCPRNIESEGEFFDLQKKFPVAGYGGIYGLDITNYFLELTDKFLGDTGTAFFFGQYAQARSGSFFIEQLVPNHQLAMSLRPFYDEQRSSWISQSDMSTNIAMVLMQDGHINPETAKKIRSAVSSVFNSHGVDRALTGILSCSRGQPNFNFEESRACFESEQALFRDKTAPEHLTL